ESFGHRLIIGTIIQPVPAGVRRRRAGRAVVMLARATLLALGGGYRLLRSVGLAPTKGKLSYHTNRLVDLYRVNRKFGALHTNGCGDFTLLDRDTWFRLRGYPEWPMFSWGIDSIFLFQADANKIPIRKLSSTQCTYHIDHGGGWTPEAQAALFGRLAEKGI